MKNFVKRISALALAGSMMLGLASCGGDGVSGLVPVTPDAVVEDASKTNIYVMIFDGGYGDEWVSAAAARFEEAYADYEFEPGKKGVKILIRSEASEGNAVLASIKNSSYNVYFTEQVNYSDFVSSGVLADITDILTEDLTAYGEDRNIVDKMDSTVENYLNIDSKYYAMPFYEAYSGIMYDIDLFQQKGFYFNTEGELVSGRFIDGVYTGSDTLSAGPDGRTGTSDDGLPATYEQFFTLCDEMVDAGVTPLIWPGANQDYVNEFAWNLWADYEGKEQMMNNYTFSGTDKSLVDSINSDGSITFKSETTITADNADLLYSQAGRYYALSFVEELMANYKTYAISNPSIMSSTLSHIDCAERFVKGSYYSEMSTIAMMINGTWWQREAISSFNELVSDKGESASMNSRRIGFMPYPKATEDEIGDDVTTLCMKSAFCFINGNITNSGILEASKKFLQFCATNESLVDFQQSVGLSWALDYDMTAEDLAECSYYSRSVYEIHNSGNVVYPYSKSDIFNSNTSLLSRNTTAWTSSTSYGTHSVITDAFYNYKTLTAKEYFLGIASADALLLKK